MRTFASSIITVCCLTCIVAGTASCDCTRGGRTASLPSSSHMVFTGVGLMTGLAGNGDGDSYAPTKVEIAKAQRSGPGGFRPRDCAAVSVQVLMYVTGDSVKPVKSVEVSPIGPGALIDGAYLCPTLMRPLIGAQRFMVSGTVINDGGHWLVGGALLTPAMVESDN